MNIYDSLSSTPTTPVGSATLTFNGTGSDAGTLASVTPIGGAGTYDGTAGTFTITTSSGQSIPIDIGAVNSASGMTQFDGAIRRPSCRRTVRASGCCRVCRSVRNGVVTASFSNGTTRPIYQVRSGDRAQPGWIEPGFRRCFSAFERRPVFHRLPSRVAAPPGRPTPGSLEGSNVDITTQLTNMIETQRAYSSNAMVIQTADQMLDTINHLNQ